MTFPVGLNRPGGALIVVLVTGPVLLPVGDVLVLPDGGSALVVPGGTLNMLPRGGVLVLLPDGGSALWATL